MWADRTVKGPGVQPEYVSVASKRLTKAEARGLSNLFGAYLVHRVGLTHEEATAVLNRKVTVRHFRRFLRTTGRVENLPAARAEPAPPPPPDPAYRVRKRKRKRPGPKSKPRPKSRPVTRGRTITEARTSSSAG